MGPHELNHIKAEFEPEGDFCSWFISETVNLCRTNFLRDIGGFDENIFLYQEDLDLCLRITRAGFSIICIPSVIALHLNSQCAGAPTLKLHWRKDWNLIWGTLYVLEKFASKSAMRKAAFRILYKKGFKSLFYALIFDKKRFIRDGAGAAGCSAYFMGRKPKRPL